MPDATYAMAGAGVTNPEAATYNQRASMEPALN
jgi:hypothetical protein